jgi:type I restriction enzyme, S subunit
MRDGWVETTLGEVVTVVNGGTPSTKNESYWGGSIIWITTTELTAFDGKSVNDSKRTITEAGLNSGPARMVQSGTTLVGTTATIGTCAIAACNLTFNQQISGLVTKNKDLNDQYLFYWIQFIKPILEGLSAGTSFKRISTSVLKSVAINLPPLPEQKRIVDLISSVDSYIDALQHQLESAKKSRNAVLHELLTAGGDDWLRAGLSEICTMIKRGQAPSYTEQKSVTVLNQKCVRNGRIQFEFARQTDSNIKPINEWAYLRAEDTLVNSTGVGTLGRVAFVGKQDEPLTVDSHLTIVRPDKNKIQPSFLGLSLHFREADIEGLAAGSSGQTELSREALGNLIITIPPIQEQKRIVEIISAMDTVVNQTELAITEGQNLRSGLLSDLLSGTHEIPGSYEKVIGAA